MLSPCRAPPRRPAADALLNVGARCVELELPSPKWGPATARLSLLEINARLSKSHAPLFRLVDGRS
ncbi:MAG: hypothetical protein GVY09_14890 [Gammaproteobacteria bacterium]|nr:hypothetical protein [Gammaproteobacteria bacterium]